MLFGRYRNVRLGGPDAKPAFSTMAFARDVSSHVVYMANGVIAEEGTPQQIFAEPRNPLTKEFLNRFTRG